MAAADKMANIRLGYYFLTSERLKYHRSEPGSFSFRRGAIELSLGGGRGSSCNNETEGDVLQYLIDLFSFYAWEPFDEVLDRRTR